MDKFELVQTPEEVRANIVSFNQAVFEEYDDNLIGKLSSFRKWYYDPNLEMFGPSKYIGYKNMDAHKYLNKKGKGADGRITEKILKQWAVKPSDEEHTELFQKLEGLLSKFNKRPNKMTKIKILAG